MYWYILLDIELYPLPSAARNILAKKHLVSVFCYPDEAGISNPDINLRVITDVLIHPVP